MIELFVGRTPQGVRGLKFLSRKRTKTILSRTPQGVRGLKFLCRNFTMVLKSSHPARGAWIEIVWRG